MPTHSSSVLRCWCHFSNCLHRLTLPGLQLLLLQALLTLVIAVKGEEAPYCTAQTQASGTCFLSVGDLLNMFLPWLMCDPCLCHSFPKASRTLNGPWILTIHSCEILNVRGQILCLFPHYPILLIPDETLGPKNLTISSLTSQWAVPFTYPLPQ